MRTLIIMIFIGLVMPKDALAQNGEKKELLEKIERLEKRNSYLEEDVKRMSDKVQDSVSQNKELEGTIKEYEPILKNLNWILGGFGLSGLLAFLISFIYYLPKKLKQEIDKEITKILTDRKSDFVAMVKEYDSDQKAKQKYTIKLLTKSIGNDRDIYNLLIKNEFKVSSETNLQNLSDANFDNNDVVFINNQGGEWQQSEVEAFLQSIDNFSFYFGKGMINLTGEQQSKFAAANIKTQFVGNLLNLLKYN